MTQNVKAVSIGQLIISDISNDVLVAYGLGSCVAVCMYDTAAQVGGMLHALLPTSPRHSETNSNPAKFVDKGVPLLLNSMLQSGAQLKRIVVRLCGGAHILSAPGFSDTLNIGHRNVIAAEAALKAAGLYIQAKDTGGNAGRTVKLQIDNGHVLVKTLGQGEKNLV